jgi:hypothetical protein
MSCEVRSMERLKYIDAGIAMADGQIPRQS